MPNPTWKILLVHRSQGGGGVESSIKMPGFGFWRSENVPILKDVLGKNAYLY